MSNRSDQNAEAVREVIDAWGRVHDGMVRALLSRLTEAECADLLRDSMRQAGAQAAQGLPSPLTPSQIGRRIMAFEAHWHIEGRICQSSAACFEREVTACPWSHFHPLSCRLLGFYMEGYVEALNPQCTYSLRALMPEGAPTCIWRIEMAPK